MQGHLQYIPSREPRSNAQGPLNKEAAKAIRSGRLLRISEDSAQLRLIGREGKPSIQRHFGQLRFRSAFPLSPQIPAHFPSRVFRRTDLSPLAKLGWSGNPSSGCEPPRHRRTTRREKKRLGEGETGGSGKTGQKENRDSQKPPSNERLKSRESSPATAKTGNTTIFTAGKRRPDLPCPTHQGLRETAV